MKKKENQNNTKKTLTICGLSALCIAALAGAYLLTREPDTEFVPASTETGSLTDSWEENTNVSLPAVTDSESTQITGSSSDQTQTVISEDESGSVSTLSDSSSKEEAGAEKPAEKPETTDDTTNPDRQPEYGNDVPQSTNPPAEAPDNTSPSSPSAGENANADEHPGQVYDPVFGWIETGDTTQDNVDNDGDINKQICTMGGN